MVITRNSQHVFSLLQVFRRRTARFNATYTF